MWLSTLGVGGSYWTAVLTGVLRLGLGMAVTVPLLTRDVLGAVSAEYAGRL